MSDSTGETAERVVRAALLQYPDQKAKVRIFTRVRDEQSVRDCLTKAAEAGAMVVFTIVAPGLRAYVHNFANESRVDAVDVIGGLIHKVGTFLEAQPINVPTATMPLSEEYFRRVEAVEFSVKSDDGREPRNFRKADLVLVGVSRTSKTPLSTYLAGRGLRVANLPLVLGVQPPKEIFDVPEDRVVCLTIDIEKLLEIRKKRLQQLGMPEDANYGLREHVRAELEFANSIFRDRPGWTVIDVSGRAIEETATIILELFKERDEARAKAAPTTTSA